uniref:SEC7 domain-containing protein n=1 Tax=Strigamia maritima TaxID=126957 RepID=T1IQX0_STRMM
MGQVLRRLIEENIQNNNDDDGNRKNNHVMSLAAQKFRDLSELPPELGLAVLSHLNATDLCLAACVWQELADDNLLWQGLCKSQWGHTSIYKQNKDICYRKLYMLLDEGNGVFFSHGLIKDEPAEIAQFFHETRSLCHHEMRLYLDARRNVLDKLIELHNYRNQFLANALRKFFKTIEAPNERGNYLQALLEKFSARFCKCNPNLGLTADTVYILCYSLILLSVDLCSPHVKNKMSKREFIRNVRNAIQRPDDELSGHLYDNIYLIGHIAP